MIGLDFAYGIHGGLTFWTQLIMELLSGAAVFTWWRYVNRPLELHLRGLAHACDELPSARMSGSCPSRYFSIRLRRRVRESTITSRGL